MASLVPFPVTNRRLLQLFAFAAVFLCYQTLAESLPKVEGVTVTKVQSSKPGLSVTWSAVSGSSITYTVCYSMRIGKNYAAPPNQSNCIPGISVTYTTLHPLSGATTYYIWVRAVSSEIKGPFSNGTMETTYNVIGWGNKTVQIVSTNSSRLSLKWDSFGDFSYTLLYHNTSMKVSYPLVTTKSLSYNITGLESNTAYKVTVSAKNNETLAIASRLSGYTTPESPVLDILTPLSSTSINVRWSPPPNSDRLSLTYHVNYTGMSRSTSNTTLTLTGLHPYEEYTISVQAGNKGGLSVPVTGTARTYSDTPSIPIVQTSTTTTSLYLQWTSSGGDNFTLYYWKNSTPSDVFTVNTTSLSYNITGLDSNTAYNVTVTTRNSAGSANISEILEYTIPEALGLVTRTPLSSTSINVRWSPPPNSDRLPLTYHVNYTGMSRSTSDTTLTLTGLHPYEEYTISVQAGNEGGLSVPVTGTARTYSDRPSIQPTKRRSNPGRRWCVLQWKIPKETGRNGVIQKYIIELEQTEDNKWNVTHVLISYSFNSPAIISYNLTDLTPHTTYKWRVAAATVNGTGPFAPNPKEFTTLEDVPTTPIVQTSTTNTSLYLQWTRSGGDTFTLYYWKTSTPSDVSTATTTSLSYNITGLDSNTAYKVIVSARNSLGSTNSSEVLVYTTPEVPPAPIIVQTSTTTTRLHLQWTSSGGITFTLYYWKNITPSDVSTVNTTSLSYNITGLDSNTAYKIIVSARTSVSSANSSEVVGYTTPEAPDLVTPTPLSSTSINVRWSPPPNSDRLPLTYHVNYTGMSRSTSDTTLTLTGLHPYEEYTISVQSGNEGGLSVPVTGTARPYSDRPSSQPTMRHSNPGRRWCVLQWKIPKETGRNGVIQKYIIKLEQTKDNKWNITHDLPTYNFSSPASISYNLTNLTPHTTYKWRVAAATVNGTGPFTPTPFLFTTLEDVPRPVSRLTYKVISESSIDIIWSEPEEPNGVIVGYSVRYGHFEGNVRKSPPLSNHTSTNDTYVTLEGLVRYIPYKATVSAKTSVGEGEPSSIVFFTLEGEPSKPVENVKVAFRGSKEVLVSWSPLTLAEAKGFPVYIVSYTPVSCPGGGSVNTTTSSVVFTEVEPCVSYVFSVQVTTGNGTNQGPTANVTVGTPLPKEAEDNLTLYAVVGGAVAAVLVIVAAIVCVTAILIRRKRRLRKKPPSAICEVDMEKKDGSEYPMGQLGPEEGVPVCDKDAESIVDVSLDEPRHERTIEKSRFIEITDQLHLNRNNGFEEEYKTIMNDPNGSDVIAKDNRHKNRYINIHTYDQSRVILSVPDASGSDYINASYIHGFRRKNAYISTQGPTTHTIADFWQMVWDQRSPVIVMLTKIEEKGKKKCERYWNEDVDDSLEPGRDLSVRVTSIMGYANYVVREITLTNNSDAQSCPHKLKHFHYIAWPDYGVPAHPYSLVKFVQQVRKEYKDSTAPMVVHCSAGVGRTGTFITIDAMMERLKEKDDLNIYQFVTEMRSRRTSMVQTMDQYAFIHDALCDYLTCGDTSIPAYKLRGEIGDMDEVDNDTRMSGFESQFKLLDSVSKKPASEDETFSRKKIVEKKNRYRDRFPYYANHLFVSGKGATSGGDYFNGTLMDSYSTKKAFIAAQAPLESTRNDVWEIIWQFRPSTIVLLCDFEEGKKTTCTPFWPDHHNQVMDFGEHQVNHKETTRRDATYDFITLDIFDRGKEYGRVRELTIHHLKNWSKNSHPPLEVILRVMGDVERAMKSTPKKVFPAMVMCDDGMARSGMFICAMSEVERVKVEGQVDVFQTIKGMRIQRPHMVDTPDQYKLCFDILQSYLDSFDAYANFKTV